MGGGGKGGGVHRQRHADSKPHRGRDSVPHKGKQEDTGAKERACAGRGRSGLLILDRWVSARLILMSPEAVQRERRRGAACDGIKPDGDGMTYRTHDEAGSSLFGNAH